MAWQFATRIGAIRANRFAEKKLFHNVRAIRRIKSPQTYHSQFSMHRSAICKRGPVWEPDSRESANRFARESGHLIKLQYSFTPKDFTQDMGGTWRLSQCQGWTTIFAIPATIHRSAQGPGLENAPRSAFGHLPQRVLFESFWCLMSPKSAKKHSKSTLWGRCPKALKKHTVGHFPAWAAGHSCE